MNEKINYKKLKSSWTKYDIVKLVDLTADNDLEPYIVGLKAIGYSCSKRISWH